VTSVLGNGIQGLNWIPKPTPQLVIDALRSMSGGNNVLLLLAFLLSVVAVLGFTVTRRRQLRGKRVETTTQLIAKSRVTDPRTALLLIWFFFTLVASLVLSFAIRPIFWDRYLSGIVPALCLLVARGVDNADPVISAYFKRVKVPMGAMIVVAVITLVAVPRLHDYYAYPTKEQWREAVQLIESDAKPSDAIVIYPDGYSTPFDYYYKGNPSMIVPSDAVVQNGSQIANKQRIWLVLMQYVSTRDATIKQDLFTRYGNDSLVLEKDFFMINVYLV